jgi:protease stability complex PrcB-like protein
MLLPSLASALVLLCTALAPDAVPFKTLDRGAAAAVEGPSTVVIRSQSQWKSLNRDLGPNVTPAPVDFTKSTVIGVFLGTRPSGGFSVEITGIERQGKELIVTWLEKKPGRDDMVTQVLTSPYHLVAIDKFDGPVKFTRAQ